jgi:hypothetical protein
MTATKNLNGNKNSKLQNLVLPTRYVEHIQQRLQNSGKKIYSPSTIHKTRMGYFPKPNPDIAKALIEYSIEYQQMLTE